MAVIRDVNNVLICELEDWAARELEEAIADGRILAKTTQLNETSRHTRGYIITTDSVAHIRGAKLFLWKGTQFLTS